jgi:hypothetical protein
MDAYVSLIAISFSNIGILSGLRYSKEVDADHPLTNRQLLTLKQHSDNYKA